MAKNIQLVVYPAKDLEKTKEFFKKYLEVEPYVDSPYYVGYKLNNLEIGLDQNGTSVIGYVDVENIESSLKAMEDAGATLHQEVKNVGGGLLIAQVKDASGNILGFRQPPK